MKRTNFAILAALVGSSAALAVGQVSAQPADALPSAAQLDAFVGDGICTGNSLAMGKNPGYATTGKYHGEKTLDGHWAVIHYEEDRTAANPKPYRVTQYIGYDAVKKQYISVTFDNSRSPYATGTSQGWKGGTFTIDEASHDAKSPSFRDTFTEGDSGMSSHTGTMRDEHGKWVKTDEETCHKA